MEYSGEKYRWSILATNTYGTKRANAYRLLENSLNLKNIQIFDTYTDSEGKEHRELNKKETILAGQKQDMIKEKFKDWIFKDRERREMLVTIYNERFNSIRPRQYDGSHLEFPGMNPEITLKPHQKMLSHTNYTVIIPCSHTAWGQGRPLKWLPQQWKQNASGLLINHCLLYQTT